jgi:hypothetical protein
MEEGLDDLVYIYKINKKSETCSVGLGLEKRRGIREVFGVAVVGAL